MVDIPEQDNRKRQHLEWLLEGVHAWNLRRAWDKFTPDLADVDIREAFDRAGQLTRVGRIPLERANLTEADLGGADLTGAILIRADLEGADLTGANVESVLSTVIQGKTNFTDLSPTASLTQDQLDSMQGDSGTIIPDHLTRPAHWPKLEEPLSPDPGPTRLPFIFLSYANQDRDHVSALRTFLDRQLLPLWWDQNITAGANWREEIASRLTAAAVFTFWTEDSIKSRGVIEEATSAQTAGKLIHARLDDALLPYGFSETQYADLRTWDGSPEHPEMRKLLQALRDKLDPPTARQMADRLQQAAPVDMVARSGKLSPVAPPTRMPHPRSSIPTI